MSSFSSIIKSQSGNFWELNPHVIYVEPFRDLYDEDKSKFQPASLIPTFYFIRKQYCDIFDTTHKIIRSKPYPYKHIERECELPDCKHLAPHRRNIHV